MALVGRTYGGAPLNGRNSMGPPRGKSMAVPHLLDLIPRTSR